MAYRALRHLKTPSGTIAPGELVPGADRWDESVRRANLNLGWIEAVSDPVQPAQDAAPPAPAPAPEHSHHHNRKGQKKR